MSPTFSRKGSPAANVLVLLHNCVSTLHSSENYFVRHFFHRVYDFSFFWHLNHCFGFYSQDIFPTVITHSQIPCVAFFSMLWDISTTATDSCRAHKRLAPAHHTKRMSTKLLLFHQEKNRFARGKFVENSAGLSQGEIRAKIGLPFFGRQSINQPTDCIVKCTVCWDLNRLLLCWLFFSGKVILWKILKGTYFGSFFRSEGVEVTELWEFVFGFRSRNQINQSINQHIGATTTSCLPRLLEWKSLRVRWYLPSRLRPAYHRVSLWCSE